ncbi:MAG TPA: transposase [Dehalococcoidia bacterium]|nr:transposase [Dehalococcoidia bacterium]
MKSAPERCHRRSLRLKEYDYSQAGAYFVTLCTKNHESILGKIDEGIIRLSPAGKVVEAFWKDLPSRYPNVELDAFVVMPNHTHGSIMMSVGAIHELPPYQQTSRRRMLLPKIIGYIKMNTARRINQLRNAPGTPVWQRSYYEHVIRNEKFLNDTRQYIAENPLRWALDEENQSNASVRQ